MNNETKRLKDEIELARRELHRALAEGMQGERVRRCSERVDRLIVSYLEAQENEKTVR